MPGLNWVLAASAAIWIGLAAYLMFLGMQHASLKQRLARLEARQENTRDHV